MLVFLSGLTLVSGVNFIQRSNTIAGFNQFIQRAEPKIFFEETDNCKQYKNEDDCNLHYQVGYGGRCTWRPKPCDLPLDHEQVEFQCDTHCHNQHTVCEDGELMTKLTSCYQDPVCFIDINGFVSNDDLKDKEETVGGFLQKQVFEDNGNWKDMAAYRDGLLACRGTNQDGKRKTGGLCMAQTDFMMGVDGFGYWNGAECDTTDLLEVDYKMFGVNDRDCALNTSGFYHTVNRYDQCLDTTMEEDAKKSYLAGCSSETELSIFTYTTGDCSGRANPVLMAAESGAECINMMTAHNNDDFPMEGYAQPMMPEGCVRQQKTATENPTAAPTKITVETCAGLGDTECGKYETKDGQHCEWGYRNCDVNESCGTICEMMSTCSNDDVVIKVNDCITNDQCFLDLAETAVTDADLTAYWQSRVYDQTGNSWASQALADDGVAAITCEFKKDDLEKNGEMCMTPYGTQFGAGGFGYWNNNGVDLSNLEKKGNCEIHQVFALDLKFYASSKCDGSMEKQVRYVVNEDNCINMSDNEGNAKSMMVHCDSTTTLTMTEYDGTADCTGENKTVILDATDGGIGSVCHDMDGMFAQANFGDVCSFYYSSQPTPAPTSKNPTPAPTSLPPYTSFPTPEPTVDNSSAAGVTMIFAMVAAVFGIFFQ